MSDPASIIARVVGQHRVGLGMTFYRDGTCKIPTCTWWGVHAPNAYPAHLGGSRPSTRTDRGPPSSPARPGQAVRQLRPPQRGLHGEPCLIITDRRDERTCGCPSHIWTPPETDWETGGSPWTPEEQK